MEVKETQPQEISDSNTAIDQIVDSSAASNAAQQHEHFDNDGFDSETEENSSFILDLTEAERDFINDIEPMYDYDNDNNTTITAGNKSKSQSNTPMLDDDEYAFLVEAGFESPEELAMLGIDIEDIRAQRRLVQMEEQGKRDLEMAKQLQMLENTSSSTAPVTSLPIPAITSQPSFSSLKREIDDIEQAQGSSSSRNNYDLKRVKTETAAGDDKGKAPIEIDDDNSDCIDLTNLEDGSRDVPISVEYYVPTNNNNLYTNPQGYNDYSDEDLDDGSMMDTDEDIPNEEAILDYLSGVRWNASRFDPNHDRLPHDGRPYSMPHYDINPSAVPYGGDYHMAAIAQSQNRRNLPSIPQMRDLYNRQAQNPEEVERELRELLANIVYDEPPPPEDRTGTPRGLSITLMEHQKIGLQWMAKMENSTNKGGILADDMGLGKTIQAMSIIVQNPCTDADPVDLGVIRSIRSTEKIKVKATLIVCPVSLIDQWRREIETKTEPSLKVLVYHGSGRTNDPKQFSLYDVIVSSYAVASSDFNENSKGPLSKVILHRVILDEAHTIKNKATRAARGCCEIEAIYRWCMTATPIQNKIDELYSLIKFLRIRPFCEWDEFRDAISKPLKAGNTQQAIKVAHVLMKAISLRRSKKALIDGRPILNLPDRNVHMTHIDFTPDERIHYDFVNKTAQARFNKYMRDGSVMKNYSSVLVLLLRLRQSCLHPSLTLIEGDGTINDEDQTKTANSMKPEVVQRLLSDSTTVTEIECPICMDIATDAQIIAKCGHILCKECMDSYMNTHDGNTKRCPHCRGDLDRNKLVSVETFLKVHAPALLKEAQDDVTPEEKESLEKVKEFVSSSKIDKMMEILEETQVESGGTDKTIVFSQFTSFLDLIEQPLKSKGFKFLRYDGSMDIRSRANTVNQFFDDPEAGVMLVSTKCGSLGLNLTCANRVIIMDVWWNPALENQAIDRAHRIGQTKTVDVHRIFINDTVEDRILELQNKKQSMADGVLGEGIGRPMSRLGLREMIYLFRGGAVPDSNDDPGVGSSTGART